MSLLVGFDDTPRGQDALALGLALTAGTTRPVTVACAYPGDDRGLMVAINDKSWVAEVEQIADRKLDAARSAVPAGADVTFRTVGPASAVRALHSLAEELEPDALVVGSSEHGSIGRLSLGSTVERLIPGAPCPVLVAPDGYRNTPGQVTSIGVAYDGKPESQEALALAVRLAERRGVPLQLVAVTPRADPDIERTLAAGVASVPDGVEVTTRTIEGTDPARILADLPEPRPSLLLCGSRGYGPVRQVLLGSVSARLVRSATYPVAVVPRR